RRSAHRGGWADTGPGGPCGWAVPDRRIPLGHRRFRYHRPPDGPAAQRRDRGDSGPGGRRGRLIGIVCFRALRVRRRWVATSPAAHADQEVSAMAAQRIDSTADVVEFLLEQHNRIRQLFAETADAATPEDREKKFFELRRLLAVHETAEEEIVHPRARRAL